MPIRSEQEAQDTLMGIQKRASCAGLLHRFAGIPTFELASGSLHPVVSSVLQGHLVLSGRLAVKYMETLRLLAHVYLRQSRFIHGFHPYGGLLSAVGTFVPFAYVEDSARESVLEGVISYDELPWAELTTRIEQVAISLDDITNAEFARLLREKRLVWRKEQAVLFGGGVIPPGTILLETGVSGPAESDDDDAPLSDRSNRILNRLLVRGPFLPSE